MDSIKRMERFVEGWNEDELADEENWVKEINSMNEASKETLDEATKEVIKFIRTLPQESRKPAVSWWRALWAKITAFSVKTMNSLAGLFDTIRQAVHSVWDKIKTFFARIKQSIRDAWADFKSLWSGQEGMQPL